MNDRSAPLDSNRLTLNRREILVAGGISAAAAVLTGTAAVSGAAVSNAAVPSAAPPPSEVPPAQVPGVPIPPGQVNAAVLKVDALAKALMATTGIPGMAVAVVHGGRTVFARGYGVRRTGQKSSVGNKVDPNTVFQLASVSKSVGATVVAHEVSRGTVAWNTPVQQHLPWFTLKDHYVGEHATIGDFYSHRTGLPEHIGDLLEDLGYTRSQILHRLRFSPLAAFRNSYFYGNFGLTAGAEAVAAAAHKDWAALSREAIYGPLGMTSTSSRFHDYIHRTNRAFGHVKINGKWVAKYVRDPDQQSPAGGVSSSVNDMAKWLIMVLAGGRHNGRQLIKTADLLPAMTVQSISSPASVSIARPGFYGFGFNVSVQASGRMQISHSGAFALGAATNIVVIPSADVAIVTLTNAAPIGVPETLNAQFSDLVQYGVAKTDWFALYSKAFASLDQKFGRLVGKKPPAHPSPAKAHTAYTGVYYNDFYGPIRVEVQGGRLVLVAGPKKVHFPLRHWNGNEFAFDLSGENAPVGSISAATFHLGSHGRAESLNIEFYDVQGLGTFTR